MTGHASCTTEVMGDDTKLRFAVRTIAVTTRAAVSKLERAGRHELVGASARRGLQLLEELGQTFGTDTPADVRIQYEETRQELAALAARYEPETAPSGFVDDRTLPEDVDVGS